MKIAVNSSESAVYRGGLGLFLIETPLTAAPKHSFSPFSPATPFSPASGPVTGSFNALHPKSNSLAVLGRLTAILPFSGSVFCFRVRRD
jgi:hypothetical protein